MSTPQQNMMQCSAYTKQFDRGRGSVRCGRQMGHAGLHRVVDERGNATEFPDSQAWFATVSIDGRMLP
jgi:hypothetical protein